MGSIGSLVNASIAQDFPRLRPAKALARRVTGSPVVGIVAILLPDIEEQLLRASTLVRAAGFDHRFLTVPGPKQAKTSVCSR